MTVAAHGSLLVPRPLDTAIAALTDLGEDGAPFAGGTWIMRARDPPRSPKATYVALGRIAELQAISVTPSPSKSARASPMPRSPRRSRPWMTFKGSRCRRPVREPGVARGRDGRRQSVHRGIRRCGPVPALLCLDASVEIATGRRP